MKSKLLDYIGVYTSEDDQRLMELLVAGHDRAFKKLFDKYKDKIFSFIFNIVSNKEVAQELTQEVFLRVYNKAHSYSAQYKFSTWIYTIARNLSLDWLKKKKDILPGENEQGDSIIELHADDSVNIEEALLLKSSKEQVKKCLDELPHFQKEALALRIFSEHSYEEIAGIIDKSPKSVKSLISRAKDSLKKCIIRCEKEES